MENDDPACPLLAPHLSAWFQYGLPNPDTAYRSAPVHSDHTYRIGGTRGTAHNFHVESWIGGDLAAMASTAPYAGRKEYDLGPDGSIEVVLSRDEQPGNWIQLAPGRGFVQIREVFLDWEGEARATLSIEREGATYPPPPITADELTRRFDRVVEFLRMVPVALLRGIEQHYAADSGTIPFAPITLGAKDREVGDYDLDGQFYGQGYFHCGPDDAVIVEFAPPACNYWSIQLASQYWESLDWHIRQTSLNAAQATLDSDGVFRGVIAHRDPGVANWLDASGHTTGLIGGRFYLPETLPSLTLMSVPFDKVRGVLPADTKTIDDATRSEILRRRLLGARPRMFD